MSAPLRTILSVGMFQIYSIDTVRYLVYLVSLVTSITVSGCGVVLKMTMVITGGLGASGPTVNPHAPGPRKHATGLGRKRTILTSSLTNNNNSTMWNTV